MTKDQTTVVIASAARTPVGAFNGALAASLANAPQAAFGVHIAFATRYAALSTESAGAATSMPQLAEVDARFPSPAA